MDSQLRIVTRLPLQELWRDDETFTHVRDVVRVLMMLMDTPEAIGEVVNVGGVEEISILHLAERVKAKVGSTSETTPMAGRIRM